jgi:repressor LexA
MAKHPLTPKQLDFLQKLLAFKRERGFPPTIREMQALGDLRSPRSVTQFLDCRERAGYIERGSGARNIRFRKPPPLGLLDDRVETTLVPVVGQVAAGLPMLAEECIEDYLPVSKKILRGSGTHFLLRVKGDSMDRADIPDRALVLVRQQSTAQPGDKVVAFIDDEATVKRFRPMGDVILLEPVSSNRKHKPIVVDRDIRIQGVVVAVIPALPT